MSTPWVWLLVAAGSLLLAALLYTVVLPHVEGPSLADQQPDRKAWLVQCPQCGRWQTLEPFSSEEMDPTQGDDPEFSNWYRCPQCERRWTERYPR